MISVTINGKQYELEGPTRVVDYLEDRGLANRSLGGGHQRRCATAW